MDEPKIREAFQKVKEDISSLQSQISQLSAQIQEFNRTLNQTDKPTDRQTNVQTTQTDHSTDQKDGFLPDFNLSPQALKLKNSAISTGNRGVQTDRQTNRQTDRQTDTSLKQEQKFVLSNKEENPLDKIGRVAELVNSLDTLKKDLRRQFKHLTRQEMFVFSTIYQLTDQGFDVDYPLISKKTNLSESSIRDYAQKLIKKGIPLEKIKENNKRVLLTIPSEFKRIASLNTLLALRGL